jgi:hypothetical protein
VQVGLLPQLGGCQAWQLHRPTLSISYSGKVYIVNMQSLPDKLSDKQTWLILCLMGVLHKCNDAGGITAPARGLSSMAAAPTVSQPGLQQGAVAGQFAGADSAAQADHSWQPGMD